MYLVSWSHEVHSFYFYFFVPRGNLVSTHEVLLKGYLVKWTHEVSPVKNGRRLLLLHFYHFILFQSLSLSKSSFSVHFPPAARNYSGVLLRRRERLFRRDYSVLLPASLFRLDLAIIVEGLESTSRLVRRIKVPIITNGVIALGLMLPFVFLVNSGVD